MNAGREFERPAAPAGRVAPQRRISASPALVELQRTAGNRAVAELVVQRQQRAPTAPAAAPSGPLLYIVVRDRGLDAGGGTYADDLERAKTILMSRRTTGEWTLVLSIHGSEDRLGAQAPPHWQQNARFYDAAAIGALFGGDPAFVRWRDQFGPNRLVMNSCQVSAGFERTLIANLTRTPAPAQARQGAQGLGEGCRPMTTTEHLVYDNPRLGFRDATITTRAQWNRIPEADRAGLQQQLRDLNREFGYFGQAPVPDAEVVQYYFDVAPRGGWAKIEVGVGPHGAEQATGIPFWNRATGPRRAEFNRLCDRGIGRLPERR
ncbi:hypothetical protein [Amycolatopsis plumensis]|uniref:DUF4347 domain-containing protein n=1 Tax=Amycolatopsis plumensis TaxID=236508 RepID=A0ABV5TU83_9PSEU